LYIRHELIYIEELQAYGDSDHGWRFKARAEELEEFESLDDEGKLRTLYPKPYSDYSEGKLY
jgi:hypothetical protein